jgi:hypothetical protein
MGLENLIDCLDVNMNIVEIDLTSNIIAEIPSSLQVYLRTETCTLKYLNLNGNPVSHEAVFTLLGCIQAN